MGCALAGVSLGVANGVGVAAVVERDAFFAEANPTRARLDQVGTLNAAVDALLCGGVVLLAVTSCSP